MIKILHINKARNLLSIKDKIYRVSFFTSDGRILSADVVCTSSNFERNTFNFLFVESRQVRTIRQIQLIQINGYEICL